MIGNKLEPFKFWCQKVLPNVYDDSLSYYEYLCKLNEYLNEVIGQINTLTDNMEDYEADLTATWLETKEYIDNYFNNLDVQQEINNKLDQMVQSGTLNTLLAPIVGTQIGDVVANQIGATVANQIDGAVAQQIDASVGSQLTTPVSSAVNDWLNSNVDPVGSAIIVDDSLLISGAAADAKETGAKISAYTIKKLNSFYKNKYRKTSNGTYETYTGAIVTSVVPIKGNMKFTLVNATNDFILKNAICFDKDMNFLGYINPNGLVANTNSILSAYSSTEYVAFNVLSTTYTSEITDLFIANWYITVNDAEYDNLKEQVELNKYVTSGSLTSVEIPSSTEQIGYYDTTGTYNAYNNIYASVLNANANEWYIYSGFNFYGSANVVFLNNSDQFIGAVDFGYGLDYVENKKFVTPTGTSKIMLQNIISYRDTSTLYKITEGANIDTNCILHENLNLKTTLNNVLYDTFTDVDLSFEATTGYYDQGTGIYYEYANISACEVDVKPNERYVLTGNAYYGMAMWVFFGANGVVVGAYTVAQTTNKYVVEITVPNTAGKMLLQRHNSTITNLRKATGKTVKSVLNNKKVCVIGDSITEYNFRAKTNWNMYINEWTGAKIQNLGRSGTGFAANYPYVDRIANIDNDTDIIGVAISFNDLFAGLDIGTATDTGTSTVAGYVNDFFDALITAFPTVPIICYCQGAWSSANPRNSVAKSYVEVIAEICENKGIPYYPDLFYGCVLKPWIDANKTYYYTTDNTDTGQTGQVDGTHPNSKGHKAIARFLYPKFAENLVTDGVNYV